MRQWNPEFKTVLGYPTWSLNILISTQMNGTNKRRHRIAKKGQK